MSGIIKKKRGLSVSVVKRTEAGQRQPRVDLLDMRVRSLASALARAWLERTGTVDGTQVSRRKSLVKEKKP